MRTPGIEPGAQAWEACMLPLHYERRGNRNQNLISINFLFFVRRNLDRDAHFFEENANRMALK